MSEIQKILSAAADDCVPSKRKEETITSQDYMKRLAVAIGEMPEADWDKLPVPAQDWYNAAADAIEKRQDIPEYPDMPKAEAAASTRRRTTASAAEVYKPKAGDVVNIVTKRGKEYKGTKIDEVDGSTLVLGDVELDLEKIEKIELAGGGGSSAAKAEPEGPKDPEVGDTVEVVTKRGKKILGNVKELGDGEVVLVDSTGDIHELGLDRIESMTIKVRAAGGKAAADTKSAPASGSSAPKKTDSEGGVKVTVRMRQLICEDLSATKDQIASALKKEGHEFKPATLDLTYSDAHRLIAILRDLKKLK